MNTIAVVMEDAQLRVLAVDVLDRVTREVPWIGDAQLDDHRQWWSNPAVPELSPQAVKRLHEERFGRARTRVQPGESGPDEVLFRKLAQLLSDPDLAGSPAALLCGQNDDHAIRRCAFERVRESHNWPFEMIGAFPVPESEAWLLCGWQPRTDRERAELAAVTREIGFDPVTRSHKLESSGEERKRDAKAILRRLEASGHSAQEDFDQADLDSVRERGADNGLAHFVAHLRERWRPLLGDRTHRPHGG